jgi:hypothetical protein
MEYSGQKIMLLVWLLPLKLLGLDLFPGGLID